MNKAVLVIVAERTPPKLSIPNVLDCGYCLVQSQQHFSLVCHNSGGPSKCKIKFNDSNTVSIIIIIILSHF